MKPPRDVQSDDFGDELAQVCAQFLSLAQLAQRSGGFRDKGRVRGLLSKMNGLVDATRVLIEAEATQADVDRLAEQYRHLMGRVFDEIRIPGDTRQ